MSATMNGESFCAVKRYRSERETAVRPRSALCMSLCDFVVKNRGKGVYYYKGGILQRLRWVATALAVCIAVGPALAEQAELTRLVDSPTAGLIEKGRYAMDMRLFANGGVAGRLQAGALQRLSIGLSFGGERLIGEGDIDWYPQVEVTARYRVIEENQTWPALVLGYETQGYGAYGGGRYQVKSKGFYLAASKNYASSFGQFGLHVGANISREDADDDDWSAWFGLDKSLNGELALLAEYDLARNDDGPQARGIDEGLLNVGARWVVAPQLRIAFYLKNTLSSGRFDPQSSRELSVIYTEEF